MARPDERARMFVVDIEQRGNRTSGRLTVRNPEGRQTVREIEATDCNEAVDALALIVALAVNPRASASDAPPAAPVETEPIQPTPAPTASTPVAPTRVPAPPSSLSVLPNDAPRWTFRGGVAAWGVGAIAPEPLFGARASAEFLHLAARVIAPSFRASLGYATHAGFIVEGGTAHFGYAATNFEICPLRLPPAGPLVLRPCVVADVGLVFARGSDALQPRERTLPWADIGMGGRLEWMLGQTIGLELDAGCMFPVWRDRFLFGTRPFHRVGWIGGVVALGFIVRIP
jgi:hypothetical protein